MSEVQMQEKLDERFDEETHFGFGKNWADYAKSITDAEIQTAHEGLLRLVSVDDLAGVRFLDIGSGSGLHSLSALDLGAEDVTAIDFDKNSVETSCTVLSSRFSEERYCVFQANILDDETLSDLEHGAFDLVYSWGVLHHTGAMWDAVEAAQRFVKPGGLFVIALYKKTPLCRFWAWEKNIYTHAPLVVRRILDGFYTGVFALGKLVQGVNPVSYIRNYSEDRGMKFMIDVRDWLGGYPYESASPEEVESFMRTRGFKMVKSLNTQKMKIFGLLGSGCAEYVFVRD